MKVIHQIKPIFFVLFVLILTFQAIWMFDLIQQRQKLIDLHLQAALKYSLSELCQNPTPVLSSSVETQLKKHIDQELYYFQENIHYRVHLIVEKGLRNQKSFGLQIPSSCTTSSQNQWVVVEQISPRHDLLQSIIGWLALNFIFIVLQLLFIRYYFKSDKSQSHLQKLKDDFISNMTHELKTPISTISVASELLLNEKISLNSELTRKYHNVILEENNRLKLLVDRVMEVSIFEKGDGRMNLTIQSAHSLINSALQGLAVIIQKKSGSLQMHLNASNDFIQIDSNHFQNIISNLVENAIKYSNLPPEISITTSNQDKEFLIQITDNGIGIDKNELSEIFTKYYRSRQSKEIKTGFGLGLYYVDKVVKAHDAQMQVKSELGRGTTFLLRFKQ